VSVPEDIQIYTNSMSRIRQRINFVQGVNANQPDLGSAVFKGELMFLQLRKVLEEIAFSSLAANKAKYSELHDTFSTHWNAKKILAKLAELNPEFYPLPMQAPVEIAPGHKHSEPVLDGFMTKPEFVDLYQISSEVLHTRNPYKEGDPAIQAKYTIDEWIARIQKLLSWHRAQLLDGSIWIVNIPGEGPVQTWPAS
jgi:hypothetical protein